MPVLSVSHNNDVALSRVLSDVGVVGVKAVCIQHPGTFILSSQCQSCFVTIIIGLINSDGRLQLNETFKCAADDVTNVINTTVESIMNGSDIFKQSVVFEYQINRETFR